MLEFLSQALEVSQSNLSDVCIFLSSKQKGSIFCRFGRTAWFFVLLEVPAHFVSKSLK